MIIIDHINIILKKYNLEDLYNKFIYLAFTLTIIREGFYWLLLLLSNYIKENPANINKYIIILIVLWSVNIPTEWYYVKIKGELLKEIKLANNDYFNERVMKMSKAEILNFDLIEYFTVLMQFSENLEQYINENN